MLVVVEGGVVAVVVVVGNVVFQRIDSSGKTFAFFS